MNRIFYFSFFIFLLWSCKKEGDKVGNQAPDTTIAPHVIKLSGNNRLNSLVYLSWQGSDADGYVKGFEISFDQQNWSFTDKNDSTFRFSIQSGSDTSDVEIFIRSVDNENLVDPKPANLLIPLKNTPPTVEFDQNSLPEDTAYLSYTFRWSASDLDGKETIKKALLKVNNSDWFEININKPLVTLLPDDVTNAGPVKAGLYYGADRNATIVNLEGLQLFDTNTFYLKVEDIAGAESPVDTSTTVYLKGKTADLLLVGGLNQATQNEYKSILNTVYSSYDEVNFVIDGGKYQPKFWDPTFYNLLKEYDKVIFFSDETEYVNAISGQRSLLLAFAAPTFQEYNNKGGKLLITNTFGPKQDISSISGTMPLDSLSSSGGQAFLQPDSAMYSVQGSSYPDLKPTGVLFGIDPFYHTADAEVVYKAQYSQANWTGPDVVGVRRSNGSNYYQYFFSMPLNRMNSEQAKLNQLFDQILNNDFNW